MNNVNTSAIKNLISRLDSLNIDVRVLSEENDIFGKNAHSMNKMHDIQAEQSNIIHSIQIEAKEMAKRIVFNTGDPIENPNKENQK